MLRISIVTVCFNSVGTIRQTIDSVLSQSYTNVEYIVVDGASTDGTLDIILDYGDRISTVISEPDKGIYDAMNKGINRATGDIVGILNSDDFYEYSRVLEDVVRVFEKGPDCALVFGDVVFVQPNDLDRVVRFYRAGHFRSWKLRFGWMPPHPATFVRNSVYREAGLYSTTYRIAADYEMFVRLLMIRKLTFRRMEKVLVRMRAGGASTAGIASSIRLNREIVRACRENGVYTNLALVLSKIPFKLCELFSRPEKELN